MGDATRTYFLEVFGEAVQLLERNALPHLVIGSMARSAILGDGWEPGSDIDFLMTKDDAAAVVDLFSAQGYACHVRDETWIYKVAKPNVTVDLIFLSADAIELDEEIQAHGTLATFEGLTLRVPSVEDLFVQNVLLDSLERQGFWYDAMRYLREVEDWSYLISRGQRFAPKKILAALLYAKETGERLPPGVIDSLTEHAAP
jgi:hypothetical protein